MFTSVMGRTEHVVGRPRLARRQIDGGELHATVVVATARDRERGGGEDPDDPSDHPPSMSRQSGRSGASASHDRM